MFNSVVGGGPSPNQNLEKKIDLDAITAFKHMVSKNCCSLAINLLIRKNSI